MALFSVVTCIRFLPFGKAGILLVLSPVAPLRCYGGYSLACLNIGCFFVANSPFGASEGRNHSNAFQFLVLPLN